MAVRGFSKLFYKILWLIFVMTMCSIHSIVASKILESKSNSYTSGRSFVRSYYSLTGLAVNEQTIYKILMEQLTRLSSDANSRKLSSMLLPYLDDYSDSSGRIFSGQLQDEFEFVNIIASHPMLSARMTYRYAVYLKPIIRNPGDFGDIYELKSISDDIEFKFGWPTQADVDDCWESLLRLHHVYDLTVEEIIQGTVFGTKILAQFNAKHCTEIGKYAVKDGFYALAVDWLEAAKLLVEQKNDTSVQLHEVEVALFDAIMTHNLEWDTAEETYPMFFTQKLSRQEPALRMKRRTYLHHILKGRRDPDFNYINFWGLCSGEDKRTEEEKITLFCWYDKESHPYWFINPLKIERIAWSPDAIQIYEVLSNSTIDALTKIGEPNLMKSKVHLPDGSQQYSKHRTSSTAWLTESQYPELKHIPRRIELVTGLVVRPENSSELLQFAAYTFGNRYEIHKDNLGEVKDQKKDEIGDRMATFMIYLSDVEKGGYTAFAQGGIGVPPVKGSAVFWYNLHRNGEPDDNSYHGGCPVIMGNKRIANKWIRSHAQTFTRTCSLDPNE